jgi:PST family polysaccharide transporter
MVFGPGFEEAAQILRVAAWLSVPAGIEAIGNLVVLKYQAKFVLLAKWALALAVALALDIMLIPTLGAYGALGALAAGYVTAVAVNFYYIRRTLRL